MQVRRLLILLLVALAALPAQAASAQSSNVSPTACFTQSPAAPKTAETITFNSSCSSDPDGNIAGRAWDLDNDGQFDDSTATSVTRSFATPGTYTIRLGVADNRGAVDTEVKAVAVANRPPTASFDFAPASPAVNERVTFTASATDPEGAALTYRWSLDGDGLFNDGTSRVVRRGYASPGTRNVTVEVTDANGGKVTATRAVTVVNRAPVACFTQTPDVAVTGGTVTFDSACSTDPDGTIASRAWDLDDDGDYDDGTGGTASRSWTAPGRYLVRLRVVDAFGGANTVSHTIVVGNRAPSAGFTFAPSRPVAGDTVTLRSTATDPDGTIAAQNWDLDNDGQYDDATGATATWRPSAAGAFTVGQRVADNSGAPAESKQTITVASRVVPRPNTPGQGFDVSGPGAPTPAPPPVQPLRLLDPFPVVRMRGRTTPRGARLTLFSVRGPHGATAKVRCKGRGCPAARMRVKIKTKSQTGARRVRFRRLERFLRAGIELRVTVTKPETVGKYTRIRIRRMKLPVRVDRCVRPGSAKPTACPEAP